MMIALLEDAMPVAGWMLDPLCWRMCTAQRGRGAFIDGGRVRTRGSGSDRPVAALGTHFLSHAARDRVHAHADRHLTVVPVPRCAAESYPRLVTGHDDIALFQRSLPWDHAAGALFVEEAGGTVTTWSGTPYRAGKADAGILAAATPRLWDIAADILLGSECGIAPARIEAA